MIITRLSVLLTTVIVAHGMTFSQPQVQLRTGLDVLLSDSLQLIQGKSIALVTNHSGVDQNGIPNYRRFLELPDVILKVIFSPEHGLFGEAAAGEKVNYSGRQIELPPVISLYGNIRKPTPEMLKGVDLIVYDIQDIGARFYTYISTLGLVMEAAGEMNISVMVLDRPNPIRGDRIDGHLLTPDFQSFVGYYPIPVQYGLTIGELARMIVGQKWISSIPDLRVVRMEGWSPSQWYDETGLPWIKPSPNIPDLETAIIYPGMCFFEATNVSEGRGTMKPFRQIGAPWINGEELAVKLNRMNLPGVEFYSASFTPVSIPGMANHPKNEGRVCQGVALHLTDRNQFKSILTGMSVIRTIDLLYPDSLEYNEAWFGKLWGSGSWKRALAGEPDATIAVDKEFLKLAESYRLYR